MIAQAYHATGPTIINDLIRHMSAVQGPQDPIPLCILYNIPVLSEGDNMGPVSASMSHARMLALTDPMLSPSRQLKKAGRRNQ